MVKMYKLEQKTEEFYKIATLTEDEKHEILINSQAVR